MNKQKKIKNYILLFVIFALGIGITLYICSCYKVYDDYQKQTPVIRGTLSEITNEEITHYILENPTTVIYMCTSSDDVCRQYEKSLKKLIYNTNLSGYIVYLNLSEINQDEFVNKFNEMYPHKVKLTTSYPAFVIFEDGRVKYILQGSKKNPLTISKTKQFIELNHIGE